MGGIRDGYNLYYQRWSEKRADYDRARREGRVLAIRVGSRWHIVTSRNEDFWRGAKELGGEWKHKTGVWSFKGEQAPAIARLVASVFGESTVPKELQ